MRILLIAPATGKWRGIARRKVFNGKTFRFSLLSLLSVAALSPKDTDVTVVDEQIEDIPDGAFDLVGITAMTAAAPRAYALCSMFRKRGIPVVMGGFHASLNTAEALEHADAVVVGPAYGAWQEVCEDVRHGRLQRLYHGSLDAEVPARLPRHLLEQGRYVTVSSLFATLGCRNACRFCSIHPFYGGARHTRAIADIAGEIGSFSQNFFLFVDDNLTQDREYALELFAAMKPLHKRWMAQVSVEVSGDPELLAAMRDAGCLGVFVGLETFNGAALADQSKQFNLPDRYRGAVRAFHEHGIFVEAGMIVGFDADGPGVFRETLRMLDEVGIDAIQLSILTPLPGTELHTSMRSRITDLDWEHYDYRHVVFEPKHMTAAELQAGADWLIASYYSPWRILCRTWRWLTLPGGWKRFLYPLVLNVAYYGRTKRFGIRGHDPAAEVSSLAVSTAP